MLCVLPAVPGCSDGAAARPVRSCASASACFSHGAPKDPWALSASQAHVVSWGAFPHVRFPQSLPRLCHVPPSSQQGRGGAGELWVSRVPPWSCWRNPPQGAQESGSGMRQHRSSAARGSPEQISPWHRVRHSPMAATFSSRSQAPQ